MDVSMLKAKIIENEYFKNSMFDHYFSTAPIGFIDVGARGGSHAIVESLHTHVSFLGFEPDREECDQLNANAGLNAYWREFKVLPHALSNVCAQRTLNILSSPTNSSLLEPNDIFTNRYNMSQKWTTIKKFPVDTIPLDHVIYDLGLGLNNSGEVIKLDTQGTEYDILEGAQKLLLEKTVCVITEVEFFQVYKDQKLFSDVELLLRKLGFSFYGFLTQHTRSQKKLNKKTNLGKERLFYADAVFFKDPLSSEVHLTERQCYVLLFSAILTGYFDFALELAASSFFNLPAEELCSINNLISTLSQVNSLDVRKEIHNLMHEISMNQESTNILLGRFIDAIDFPDFEDCSA
jgi:FkbM family methyltransferase